MDYCYSIRKAIYQNEILAMYCNVYDFELFCGVSSAANLFSKEPKI
jgi:hypothetical protein